MKSDEVSTVWTFPNVKFHSIFSYFDFELGKVELNINRDFPPIICDYNPTFVSNSLGN